MNQETKSFIVRSGKVDDLPQLTDIYNYYVENTAITFDVEPYTVERRKESWFYQYTHTGVYRLLVAECDEMIVGYATSSKFRPKAAYATSVETSIYLKSEFRGRGIATLLYGKLFEELKKTDIHRAYGGITLPNDASIALHKKFGFSEIGTYHEVGTKFGERYSVRWFEKKMKD